MAAVNFIYDLHQKVYALLEGHTPTAGKIKPANEVRAKRDLDQKKPADFPRIYLRVPRLADTGFTLDPTFAIEESAFDATSGDWHEQIVVTMELKVVHERSNDLDLEKNSLFEVEVLTALRKGGPKLGLSYVRSLTFAVDRIDVSRDKEPGQTNRAVSTFRLAVTLDFEGSELVT